MPDYQLGKIYKITSPQTELCYIGSTTKKYVCQRFGDHKSNYKRWKQGKTGYVTSFDILQYNDALVELVETFPCNIVEELRKREGEIIKEYGEKCVNKRIECRDLKEYYQDYKEEIKERSNLYYKENKEKVSEQNKKYREQNIEKYRTYQKEYREENKEKIKEKDKKYYETNREKIKEYVKNYREENIDTIKEKRKETYICECGKEMRKIEKARHERTRNHIDVLKGEKEQLSRKEYGKKYREENKEKIEERKKIKYTCCCGLVLTREAKIRHEKSKKHIQWIEENK